MYIPEDSTLHFLVVWKFNEYFSLVWSQQNWCCVFQVVSEMASAAGLVCKVDPTLVAALRSQKNGNRITVLFSIRAAQTIYVSHFISSVNEVLSIRYLFNSYTASYTIPVLWSPLSSRSLSSSKHYAMYIFVPMLFAVIKCLFRAFSWHVQKCIIVAVWNSSTKEKWQSFKLENKWKLHGARWDMEQHFSTSFQYNHQYSFTQFEKYMAWQYHS